MLKKLDYCTVLIWNTGRVVIVGARSEEFSLEGCKIIANLLEGEVTDFRVHNVVGSRDLDFGINLSNFYDSYRANSSWEPELFPALTYRINGVVVNIFSSGKLVITGAKSVREVYEIFDIVYPKLLLNKK